MYLIGDIGNTEIKIHLFNNNLKLIKKIRFSTNELNYQKLDKKLKFLKKFKSNIQKIIFSSVVPNVFKIISFYIKKKKLKLNAWSLKIVI